MLPVDSDVSINDYFDHKTILCLISLSNSTNNKEAFDLEIPNRKCLQMKISNLLQVAESSRNR